MNPLPLLQSHIAATTLLQAVGMTTSNEAVRRRTSLLKLKDRFAILTEDARNFDTNHINAVFERPTFYRVFGELDPLGTVQTFSWSEVRTEWNNRYNFEKNFTPLKWTSVDYKKLVEKQGNRWSWTPKPTDFLSPITPLLIPDVSFEEFQQQQRLPNSWGQWMQRQVAHPLSPMEF